VWGEGHSYRGFKPLKPHVFFKICCCVAVSWGSNTVAQFEQNHQKGSNFLVTLGNPEYEAFVQNIFKLVRWASGVIRRQRFFNQSFPCDADEMSVEGRWDC
jgi:hypothetical protein